jgi:SAM-dependent methyltransferase
MRPSRPEDVLAHDQHLEEAQQGLAKHYGNWERRYKKKKAGDFGWHLSQPPPELIKLLESGEVSTGPAVDIGCGPGVATSHLAAQCFRPAVGLDIAFSAVCQARDLARDNKTYPVFVVAAAPFLPFLGELFTFIFDRGCMHALPESYWPLYLQEIERLLMTGGVFQLLAKRPSPSVLEQIFPASLQTLTMEEFPFHLNDGRVKVLTHGIFKKR